MKTLLSLGLGLMINLSATAQKDSCFFYAPNTVTSNCDAFASYQFEVVSSCTVSSAKLSIYDRWGTVISTTEGKKPIWDAGDAIEGTYHYRFEGYYAGGVPFEVTGYTNVLR